MRAIDAAEMKKLEEYAAKVGIPASILMENAGKEVASSILSSVKWIKRAVVLAGKGNNGGDGFVASRYLHKHGIKLDIFLLDEKDALTEQSKANLEVLEKIGMVFSVIKDKKDAENLKVALEKSDVLIDAVYGTGFNGEINGITADIFDLVNDTKHGIKSKIPYKTVSIDCPSGINMTTGEASTHAIRADITITFEYYKTGLLKYPGSINAGKIIVVDIGIPKPNPIDKEPGWMKERKLEKEKVDGINVIDAAFVASTIPQRRVDVHKGSCGKVLVIAGSPGMTGAAVLCGRAALRVGAGSVVIGVPGKLQNIVDSMSLETITWGLPQTKDGILSSKSLKIVLKNIDMFDVIAVGPGLSANKEIAGFVKGLLRSSNVNIPIILDADALNSIDIGLLKECAKKKDISITPHPGELSRLINMTINEIQANRIDITSKVAFDNRINVVLKGAYTVIASADKKLFINPMGSPSMASAGVGDVLTGAMAGLIAQGIDTINALAAATYIHGMAGNIVSGVKGEHGLIASDILDSLPFVIESIIKSA